jgi:hypothetical protein
VQPEEFMLAPATPPQVSLALTGAPQAQMDEDRSFARARRHQMQQPLVLIGTADLDPLAVDLLSATGW